MLEGGTAYITVGFDRSMANTARQLETLELIKEEGGIGQILEEVKRERTVMWKVGQNNRNTKIQLLTQLRTMKN